MEAKDKGRQSRREQIVLQNKYIYNFERDLSVFRDSNTRFMTLFQCKTVLHVNKCGLDEADSQKIRVNFFKNSDGEASTELALQIIG